MKSCSPFDQSELNPNPTNATHPAAGLFTKGNKAKILVPTMSEPSSSLSGSLQVHFEATPEDFLVFLSPSPALSSCRRQSHLNAKPFISKMPSPLVVKATFIVSPSPFPPPIKNKKTPSSQGRPPKLFVLCRSCLAVVFLLLLFVFYPPPPTHTHHTCSVKPICPRSKPDVDP